MELLRRSRSERKSPHICAATSPRPPRNEVFGGVQLYSGEEVFGRFVVARGHGAVMFDFVEETLDKISVSGKIGAEGWHILAVWHGPYVGPCTAFIEALPQRVAVIGTAGQKDLPLDKRIEHIVCAAPVMGLAFGQFQSKRQARGIDKRSLAE